MTTREERAKARALKRKKQKLIVFFAVFLCIVIAVLVAIGIVLNKVTPDALSTTEATTEDLNVDAEKCYNAYLASSMVLKDYIMETDGIEQTVKKELGDSFNATMTVFLSVSDGENAAYVVSGSASTLDGAWNAASEKMGELVREKLCAASYVKADIVNHVERINASELSARISAESGIYGEFFRKGISFDGAFASALLEAELNSSELIDYDIAKNIVLDKVNLYLSSKNCPTVSSMPDKLWLFSCRGYMKDADGCYTLVSDNGSSYGRRELQTVDYACVTQTLSSVSRYMLEHMTENGKFTYGIYPVLGLPIDRYDIGFHAMALSALLQYAEKLDSAGLYTDQIDLAMQYLVSQLVQKDENTMYAADADHGEITACGNIQSILALCDYQAVKTDSEYLKLAEKLGNGLLDMIDPETGKPYHVLYYKSNGDADFTVKAEQTDRIYDSSAVYALCRLYGLTNDDRYLNAACGIADAMIKENYAQYNDCWVSVAMEELTLYKKNAEYYNLALQNFNDSQQALETRVISMPQYTRLLVSTYNIYAAMQANKITTELFTALDHDKLVTMTVARANDLLNGIAYSEVAMYFRNPSDCLNAFFIRQDGFRIRIDDMAEFVRAYIGYAEIYTSVSTDAFNIASIQAAQAAQASETALVGADG